MSSRSIENCGYFLLTQRYETVRLGINEKYEASVYKISHNPVLVRASQISSSNVHIYLYIKSIDHSRVSRFSIMFRVRIKEKILTVYKIKSSVDATIHT